MATLLMPARAREGQRAAASARGDSVAASDASARGRRRRHAAAAARLRRPMAAASAAAGGGACAKSARDRICVGQATTTTGPDETQESTGPTNITQMPKAKPTASDLGKLLDDLLLKLAEASEDDQRVFITTSWVADRCPPPRQGEAGQEEGSLAATGSEIPKRARHPARPAYAGAAFWRFG